MREPEMKKLLLAAALLASPAYAQVSCTGVGQYQYCNGSVGGQPYSSTQSYNGAYGYGQDSQGNSWNSSRVGGTTYYNYNHR
jgi:hypothetical protein